MTILRFLSVILGAAAGVGLFLLLDRGCTPPRNEQQDPNSPAREEVLPVEDWVARVAQESSGTIRTVADSPGEPENDWVCTTQGPLSRNGHATAAWHIERRLTSTAAALDKLSREPSTGTDVDNSQQPSSTALAAFLRELRLVAEYQKFSIIKEQLASGSYITLANGAETPKIAEGWIDIVISPVELERGGFGSVLFLIDKNKHPTMKQLYAAITETHAADRSQRIEAFNSMDFGQRKEWVERYLDLDAKSRDGIRNLDTSEMLDYVQKSQEIRYLRVDVDRTRAWLTAR